MNSYQELMKLVPSIFKNENSPLEIITDFQTISKWEQSRRQELLHNHQPEHWARIGIVLDDPYILCVRDLVKFPNGAINGYIRIIDRASLENGQGVAILPYDQKTNRFLLLRHFRHATRSWHLEIPRGFGEPNITPIEQAKQELWEELKISSVQFQDLGKMHANTGLESTETQLFFASGKFESEPNRDEGIDSVAYISNQEFEEQIKNCGITDSFTIAAYFRAKLRGFLMA